MVMNDGKWIAVFFYPVMPNKPINRVSPIPGTPLNTRSMKLIKDVMEENKDIPVCPKSWETNLYYLIIKHKSNKDK